MNTKDCRFECKDFDEAKGEFTGFAAVYNNLDLGGDIVKPGAFARTIKATDGEVPLLWSHDPTRPIGGARLEDSDKGLRVFGKIDLNVPGAQSVYRLMRPLEGFKRAAIRGLSFGYDVVKHSFEGNARLLQEVKLYEVSPVVFPMNPKATISAVKAEDTDASMVCQSLVFSKEVFATADDAKAWAEENDYKADKVDETENSFRLRQRDPAEFDADSFKTKELAEGVSAVMGKLLEKSFSIIKASLLALQAEVKQLTATLVDAGLIDDPDTLHSFSQSGSLGLGALSHGDSLNKGGGNPDADPDALASEMLRDMKRLLGELNNG